MRVIESPGVPIKVWTDPEGIEPQALQQLKNTASLPCIYKHVAVMPDVHFGIGATVGSVIATEHAVIPAAVGVDIGCGMMAAQMPFQADRLPDSLKALRDDIEWGVPVGFNEHKEPTEEAASYPGFANFCALPHGVQGRKEKALRQLGTLGGGNHFIEVCLDTDQNVWVMLHSGSRNIGNEIAKHHIEEARGLMRQYFVELPDPDLAFFAENTPQFMSYWQDLQWAQRYAMRNREIMMTRVLRSVAKIVYGNWQAPLEPIMSVNCHHNYAEREHHFGNDVIVTRKGAVRARQGDMGIIPGSMGAKSFIVRGKGNPDSFCSCSHGAGRRMSRKKAKDSFGVQDLERETAGVECRKDSGVIDEIPSAYKSIDEVMANQADLVEIMAVLKQVLCVKG